MKMVKSLLLGSAAGLVAIAGAQAADLPVKAKPVQYVKICSLYGVGFYYVPGTDMCIKVGGWARFETAYGYNGSLTNEWYANNLNNRSTADNTWRVKGTVTVDARSPTEYGTVRSYVAMGLSTSNNGNGNGALPAVAGTDGVGNYFNRWFIQWAGFTFGKSTSFFDFYSIGANQYGFVGAGSDTGDGGWLVAAYTAQFGNGFSGSISLEEQRRTQILNVSNLGISATNPGLDPGLIFLPIAAATGAGYEGQDYPDVVASLRVDQGWGSAQVMGALHNVASTYYGSAEGTGHPSDKLGFAVGAGIKLNADMIAKGDYFQAEADYTQGASRYANHTAGVFNYIEYHGTQLAEGWNTDAVFGAPIAGVTSGSLQLTTAWAVNAAYTHNWNAQWKSTLWGSYMAQNYNTQAKNLLCFGVELTIEPKCDMNWNIWGAGLRTQWAISSSFYIGLEVLYSHMDSVTETASFTPQFGANGTKPAQNYFSNDPDNWAVRFRVHRDFYP